MKSFITLIAFFAINAANGAENLQFGDTNYFIHSGQINIISDLSQQNSSFVSGPRYSDQFYLADLSAAYGINDRLNLNLGMSYKFQNSITDLTTKPVQPQSYSNEGQSNPKVGLNYRFLNQQEWRYNLDFGIQANWNFQDSKVGRNQGLIGYDGNNIDPRSSIEINSKIGRKWNEANEWQMTAGVLYFDQGEATLQGSTNEEFKIQDSMNFYLQGLYQYRPVNEFMMVLSAKATKIGEAEYQNKSFGYSLTETSHLDLDFRFTAKYLITNQLIAKFNYGQARYPNYELASDLPGGDKNYDKRRNNFWGLGLDLLF